MDEPLTFTEMNDHSEGIILELVHQIRLRAGEIGLEINGESNTGSEAGYYDYLVQDGLATAILEILGNDWSKFQTWLIGCVCNHNLGGQNHHAPLLRALEISDPAHETNFGIPSEVRALAIHNLLQWVEKNPI